MGNRDARSLSAEAQEDLRRRVVKSVQKGVSQSEAARIFAVARPTVNRWMQLVEREGSRALQARRRGRPRQVAFGSASGGDHGAHDPQRLPRSVELAVRPVDPEAVQQLLSRKFDVQVSVWTVGRYLRAWGCTHRSRCDGRTNKIRWPCGNGWRKNILRFAHRPDSGKRKFIGWTRWGCVRTIRRDEATDAGGRRRSYLAPASVFVAT